MRYQEANNTTVHTKHEYVSTRYTWFHDWHFPCGFSDAQYKQQLIEIQFLACVCRFYSFWLKKPQIDTDCVLN